MSEIENFGVTVEEYLDSLEKGIDLLELKRLEAWGIPTHLALEVMEISDRITKGTATLDEIMRGLMIMSPPIRQQLK